MDEGASKMKEQQRQQGNREYFEHHLVDQSSKSLQSRKVNTKNIKISSYCQVLDRTENTVYFAPIASGEQNNDEILRFKITIF